MGSRVTTPNTEAAILGRILEADELSPAAAQYLLSMRLPASDEKRVDELSAKARAGSLSEAEAEGKELDGYLHVGSLLAAMQSNAQRLSKRPE